MILNNDQQKRFIYFLTLGLLVLICVPIVVFITQSINKNAFEIHIIIALVLGTFFFITHQYLIKVIICVSNRNQLKQEDIKFASFLIYSKLYGVEFNLTKDFNKETNCHLLNYKSESVRYSIIRKRAIFTLMAIQKTPNVVITAELRQKLQDEWTDHLESELSFDERVILWRSDLEEVIPLLLEHEKNIKRLTCAISDDPDLKAINKILDSLPVENSKSPSPEN